MRRAGFWAMLILLGLAYTQGDFKASSPDFSEGKTLNLEQIYNNFGCTGGNISPEINWVGAPKDTKSFAVTLFDPDAPVNGGWWHWLIYDIPADANKLAKGAGDPKGTFAPAGSVQSPTSFGTPGYGGSCPPQGSQPHHYVFTIYALKVAKLEPASDKPVAIKDALEANALAKFVITALYGR